MRTGEKTSLLRVCWEERRRDEEQGKKTEWNKQRGAQISKCGVAEEKIDKWIENEEPWVKRRKKIAEGSIKKKRKD